ncbi:MAG TPA: KOW motif-containing protein, partial [Geobacterales bacterium]|nr:KOW motif-containing protein [Geobacterales bacterium]
MLGKKSHIKKGDMVQVIAGKEKTKTGKVLRVLTDRAGVIVEGLNKVKR